jgi:two-component system, cell cycle sensor histidine kinase and response regulator CckA
MGSSHPPLHRHEAEDSPSLRPGRADQPVVLVVDDEAMIRDMARLTLEEAGYFVLTAEDGEQALEISRSFSGTIHVLVVDVIMPKLDGVVVREQILRERPRVKVLLLSGQVDPLVEGVAFLPKPFLAEQLRNGVRRLLVPKKARA